jgi:hypothetical protein
MSCLGKKFVLMLVILLIVSSALLVTPCAAPVTMPDNVSVAPEFASVVLDSHHYWWSTAYETDPYTGEVKEFLPGRYIPMVR